ncbi:hypothetical protein OZN62_08615 [Aurantiacibacter sp. MUD11]|uniref:hypothetical protein n=1 Tax=Aurantiacibacter sp. MUD11 TaxID=3003265 RepID=UPI0022AA656C|nr:hypothetical protein [Aurantiacibacter sp. MUD11]WAT17003.1 hypothetical protein OZN62_08615 [Aurantiacibacter sp. MUD11]
MANSPEHIDGNRRSAKPPITASPAFPWVVALWFAALLGIGSLIIPAALLERVTIGSGLASILPQAAPPLGFTARALIALAGAVGGGALGYFLARRISAGASGSKPKAKPGRILSAREDIGDDGIAVAEEAEATPGGRRRALAMEEEERPSDFLNVVPLPGADDVDARAEHDPTEEAPEEPVAHAGEEEPRQEFVPTPEPEPEELLELDPSAELTEVQEVEEQSADDESENEFHAPEPHFERQEFIAAVAEAEDHMVTEEPEGEAEADEPLAFSPPSMTAVSVNIDVSEVHGPEDEDDVTDKQIFEGQDSEDAFFAADMPHATDDAAGEDEEDGEGLVQLVQRLGDTLEKHREWSAEQAAARKAAPVLEPAPVKETAAEAPVPEDFDPAGADDAAEAMAAWFGKSAAMQAEPVSFVEDEEEDNKEAKPAAAPPSYQALADAIDFEDEDDDGLEELTASFSLPRATAVEPVVPTEYSREDDEDEFEDEEDDTASSDNFASLNPFKRQDEEFPRIEEPEPEADGAEPAVLFPGQQERKPAPAPTDNARPFDPPAGREAPVTARSERPKPSNDDNERALREALLNLQRMSK